MNQAYRKEADEIIGRTRVYHSKAANDIAKLDPCPRSVDDVYVLGMILQNHICGILHDIQTLCDSAQAEMYGELILEQLSIKDAILDLANKNLNQLLHYYYSNGGPIMDILVTEAMARDINPFFNHIASNFLNDLDVITNLAYNGTITASELGNAIDNYMNATYQTMGKMFPFKEMQHAFNKLVEVRQA